MARTLLKIVYSRYKQFGGMRVVCHYARMGALKPLVKGIIKNPFSRQAYLSAYQDAARVVGRHLMVQYAPLMKERREYYAQQHLEHEKHKIIWFCWMQGMEQAPKMVKVCHASIVKNLPDREVKIVDGLNWREYVELPGYIVEKWNNNQIPPAHFADLLRVSLLIKYGGTWIDSTVLCTGLYPQNEKETLSYLDADLFMFQYTRPGSNQWGGIGNWFITSCTNNEVLLVLRDMLFAYWNDYGCMLDYYIFHQFFSMLRSVYPSEIAAMPYGYAPRSLELGRHWGDVFNQERWDNLVLRVCFHKLSYNVREKVERGNDNYYHYLVNL